MRKRTGTRKMIRGYIGGCNKIIL